ncbi:MAG: dienelactone hydrolase family protein, partial [Arenimonas sp.]
MHDDSKNRCGERAEVTLPRRTFINKLTAIAGGVAATGVLAAWTDPGKILWQGQTEKVASIKTDYAHYAGSRGLVRAYVARPDLADTALPALLILHENRGLTAHIKEVANRAASAGYLVIAPDGLSVVGGAPRNLNKARDLFYSVD